MTHNKIIIEEIGQTFILPVEAVFSFNNKVLEVSAPNFLHKFNNVDIQDIYLLDQDSENQCDLKLVELLRRLKEEKEEKKEKKKVKLTSGMI